MRLNYLDNLKVMLTALVVFHHAALPYSPGSDWAYTIHIEPAHYLQYAMMFLLGILAYRFQWLTKMTSTTGAIALAIVVAFAIGNFLRDGGPWNDFVWKWFGIYESFLCVFVSFGLLWLFRECINDTGKLWNWCAQQAYGAYIVHLFVLLFVQNATDPLVLPGIVKFFIIATIATILSFVLTYLLRLIPGVKRVL